MSLSTLLPLASTIMAAVFAVSLLRRYARRKGKHLLIWGIAMIMYGLGTFAEFYLSLAWSPTIFRLWYLCGAMLVAAWLGQGTIHLLVRRPHVADILLAVLTITSVIAAIHLFATPLNESLFNASLPVSQQYATNSAKGIVGLMPEGGVRSYSFLFNIYGTVALVGGALYSAYIFWRKRILPQRVLGNVLDRVRRPGAGAGRHPGPHRRNGVSVCKRTNRRGRDLYWLPPCHRSDPNPGPIVIFDGCASNVMN